MMIPLAEEADLASTTAGSITGSARPPANADAAVSDKAADRMSFFTFKAFNDDGS